MKALAITVLAIAIAMAHALPVDHHRLHRFAAQHHNAKSAAHRSHSSGSRDTSVADTVSNADSAATAAATAEIAFAVTADSAAGVSSAFRAAVARGVASIEAADQARITHEFATRRGRAAAEAEIQQQVDAKAAARAWDPVRTPAVCTAIWTWLVGLGGGFGAAAGGGVNDATCITNWGGANLGAYNAGVDNVHAADIIHYLRYQFGLAPGGGAPAACGVAALQVSVATHAAYTAVAVNKAQFTMGVEWELKWLQVDPEDHLPGNDPAVFAQTGGNTPLGQPWLKVESDNSGNNVIPEYNIPEFITGADFIGTAGAANTQTAITNIVIVVRNLEQSMLALGPNPGWWRGDNVARDFQYVGMQRIANALHARNQGQNGGTAHANANAFHLTTIINPQTIPNLNGQGVNYPGPRTEFAWRPTNLRATQPGGPPNPIVYVQTIRGNENAMFANYVQTNFLMPISSLATERFSGADGNAHGLAERYAPARTFITAALTACQTAARAYLVAEIPVATLAAMTGAQRGDLLGVFTLFNYHFLYRWYTAAPVAAGDKDAWGDAPPGGFQRVHGAHWKNWFDIMPKTSVHKALELVDPVIAEVLRVWFAGKDFLTENAWADTIGYFQTMRAAMNGVGGVVQTWAAAATGLNAENVSRKTWALGRLRFDLCMFNPATLRNPPPALPNAGHSFSTSPTHSRPPALIVNGVLSIVMESRARGYLDQQVLASNHGNANTWLNRHNVQKTWNGLIGQFAQ